MLFQVCSGDSWVSWAANASRQGSQQNLPAQSPPVFVINISVTATQTAFQTCPFFPWEGRRMSRCLVVWLAKKTNCVGELLGLRAVVSAVPVGWVQRSCCCVTAGQRLGRARSCSARLEVSAASDLGGCVCPRSRSSSTSTGSTVPQTWFSRAWRARSPWRWCLQTPPPPSPPAPRTRRRDPRPWQVRVPMGFPGIAVQSAREGRWPETPEGVSGVSLSRQHV